MAAPNNYARLGLFIVVIVGVALATALFFIQRFRSRAVIDMVTYTNENVSGLDISSPVRYWGVSVGRVTNVRVVPSGVDPRNTIVGIEFEVFLDRLSTIGVSVGGIERLERLADIHGVVPDVRSRLVSNPLTGEAYLLLDVPKNPPPPIELGFTPDKLYVPSMPSTLSTVQDRLPAFLDHAEETLRTFREIVSKVPASLDRSDRYFANLERIMQESQLPGLSADTRNFFATTTGQIGQMTSDLHGAIGKEGAFTKASEEMQTAIRAANFPATSQATREAAEEMQAAIKAANFPATSQATREAAEEMQAAIKAANFPATSQATREAAEAAREAADNSRLAADALRRSLPAIRESLEDLSELARQLQEQPESLVYGKAKQK
jgi:paraquat-inducible protein B